MIPPLFRRPDPTIATLYGAIVTQARDPRFYEFYGVPDTVLGRFDLIVLHLALLLRRLRAGDPSARALAQSLFEKAKPHFELRVQDHPDDAVFLDRLGKLYAYLGRKEDAISASRRAVELMPESKDADEAPDYASNLALVYARTGEADQAIALIEQLLTKPNGLTLAELRLRWEWDPLRNDPRFKKILAGPEPKTVY